MAEPSKDPIKQPTVSNDEAEAEAAEAAEAVDQNSTSSAAAADPKSSSLKNKLKKKVKNVTGGGSSEAGSSSQASNIVDELVKMNPNLKEKVAGMDKAKALEMLKKMDIGELMTGMSLNAKNQADMGSHKFWKTQPVPQFTDKPKEEESGPIAIIKAEDVRKEPYPLPKGYEWVTLNLEDDKEIKELYDLLLNHYVEDDNAMFRFKYSKSFLNWALKSPEWKKEWHVGVRTSESKKLVASICGIPTTLRVGKDHVPVSEINFLCIHKKLRSQRLAPMLIREVTRRCNVDGVFQAVYTAGVVIPTPVSSCRYYHRSLDWLKLYEVGFSPLPPNSTKARMVSRYQLPTTTFTPNLRPMEEKDVDGVLELLNRFLDRYKLSQVFTRDEVVHFLLNKETPEDQVIYTYVVEKDGKITDFVSFYRLESTVIKKSKYDSVKAAFLYYYATETAFAEGSGAEKKYKERVTALVQDALIEAKKVKFDVFNALTLQDNPYFLEQLKFGAGDGMLHYYLYNYRTPTIPGGLNDSNLPDEKRMGGIGMVML